MNLLVNRLLVEDAIPEALETPMDRPLVIVGLPRTGTSHLHNLLSVHPELRFLPYWESCKSRFSRPVTSVAPGCPTRASRALRLD